jgi:DNA-binding transcriptional regulator YhcF (GntR family)
MHSIKEQIISGKLLPGDKLPSSREYSQDLGLNFNTVARVYKELEMENIVFTKRGIGTFITESEDIIEDIRLEIANELIDNFIRGMYKIGFNKENMINLIKNSKIINEGNE